MGSLQDEKAGALVLAEASGPYFARVVCMRQLRFALLLPIAQLVVALLLLQWGNRILPPRGLDTIYMPTPTLVCTGINGPAVLFRVGDFLTPQAWKYMQVGGFSPDELWLLLGVLVVWFLIGRALDARRLQGASTSRIGMGSAIASIATLIVAASLLFLGLKHLHPYEWNNPASPVVGILFIVWSLTIGFLSGRKLTRFMQEKRASTGPGARLS